MELLIVIFNIVFVIVATFLLRYAAIRQNKVLYWFFLLIISFFTILYFGKQATNVATTIGFGFASSLVTNSLHNGQYTLAFTIAVLFFCIFWYAFYPISLIGRIISLILLILSWIALKYNSKDNSYVDNVINRSIEHSISIYEQILIKLIEIFLITLLSSTSKYKKYLLNKLSKTTVMYLFSKNKKNYFSLRLHVREKTANPNQ